MKRIKYVFGAVALMGLSACQVTTATVDLDRPPEVFNCPQVPQEIAVADHKTKTLGVYDSFGAYWSKRSERLVARYYVCKNR